MQTSREAGDVFAFKAPGIGDDMQAIVENMKERFLWIWEHDVVADAEAAARDFEERVGRGEGEDETDAHGLQMSAVTVGKVEEAETNVSKVMLVA